MYCPFLHEKRVLLLRLSAKDCLLSVGNGCSNSCPTNGPRESPVARSEPMQTKMIGREAVWICCSRSVKLSVKLDIERSYRIEILKLLLRRCHHNHSNLSVGLACEAET